MTTWAKWTKSLKATDCYKWLNELDMISIYNNNAYEILSGKFKNVCQWKNKIPLSFDFFVWLNQTPPKLLPFLFWGHSTAFDLVLPQQPFFIAIFQGLVFNCSHLKCRSFPELWPGLSVLTPKLSKRLPLFLKPHDSSQKDESCVCESMRQLISGCTTGTINTAHTSMRKKWQ